MTIDDILVATKLCACDYCFLIFEVGRQLCRYRQKGASQKV